MKRTTDGRIPVLSAFAVLTACGIVVCSVAAQTEFDSDPAPGQIIVIVDEEGDAEIHRMDTGNDGEVNPDGTLPDLLYVSIGGWVPVAADVDPFAGGWTDAAAPDLLRLDMVFSGLVNPCGPLGVGYDDYIPFMYGDSPLLGYLEIDVDGNIDTGGTIGGAAINRYLGTVGRFGGLPAQPMTDRAAMSGIDHDHDFFTPPFVERSGEDFALALCSCFEQTVIELDMEDDGSFDPGNQWLVHSRFFPRASGYIGASGVDGGSVAGAYDPHIDILFSHDIDRNWTTVSLVYPLTQQGAADMMGADTAESIDTIVDNQFSMQEAIVDLIVSSQRTDLPPAEETLIIGWADYVPDDAVLFLNPDGWRVTAVFGMPYVEEGEGFLVWTDVGGDWLRGDLNGDRIAGQLDRTLVEGYIAALDGTEADADAVVNGQVVVPDFSANFAAHDIGGDGVVGQEDVGYYGQGPSGLLGDADNDGDVDQADLGILLAAYGTVEGDAFFNSDADFDRDGQVNQTDLGILLANYGISG
ncbi:MAG: hypothetical protein KAS72_12670 [Phycisphaerales bacterium]|nr:hypothetical protein [Phycisphaerales bacterium]